MVFLGGDTPWTVRQLIAGATYKTTIHIYKSNQFTYSPKMHLFGLW